jgi:hypothetical protein
MREKEARATEAGGRGGKKAYYTQSRRARTGEATWVGEPRHIAGPTPEVDDAGPASPGQSRITMHLREQPQQGDRLRALPSRKDVGLTQRASLARPRARPTIVDGQAASLIGMAILLVDQSPGKRGINYSPICAFIQVDDASRLSRSNLSALPLCLRQMGGFGIEQRGPASEPPCQILHKLS